MKGTLRRVLMPSIEVVGMCCWEARERGLLLHHTQNSGVCSSLLSLEGVGWGGTKLPFEHYVYCTDLHPHTTVQFLLIRGVYLGIVSIVNTLVEFWNRGKQRDG
jgi:hypothetical protein